MKILLLAPGCTIWKDWIVIKTQNGWPEMNQMLDEEYFGSDDAEQEIERLDRVAEQRTWTTPQNRQIHLTIPPTVYPPREDTDLLARVLHNYPEPRGKKLLDIGCGSGALSLFAAQIGFHVTACDINPFAVASSRHSAEQNGLSIKVNEGGPGPQIDGDVRQWAGNQPHDVIIWNLPYLVPVKNSPHLGPLEEAALLDTDQKGLVSRLLHHLQKSKILAKNGTVFLLVSQNEKSRTIRSTCIGNGYAIRSVSIQRFEDGECLEVFAVWRPFEHQEKLFEAEINSTNTFLLDSKNGEGTFLQAGLQRAGHGRRGRKWSHEDVAFAGSWVIQDSSSISNPSLLQLQGGMALHEAIDSCCPSEEKTVLKWPNDALLNISDELRKVGGVLVESASRGKSTRIILGIGCNIASKEQKKRDYSLAALNELNKEIKLSDFEKSIQASVASWFERKDDVNDVKRKAFLEHYLTVLESSLTRLGEPFYRGIEMAFEKIDYDGRITLKDGSKKSHLIEDGEHVIWSNYATD